MFLRLLRLLLFFSFLDNVISIESQTLAFNDTFNVLPDYYKQIIISKGNYLTLIPSKKGKMLRLIRPINDSIKFELNLTNNKCSPNSKISFFFPQEDESKFCIFVLDIKTQRSIKLEGGENHHPIYLENPPKKIEITVTKDKFELKYGELIRNKSCELDIETSYNEENVIADFFLFDSNDCHHELILPETSQLALWILNDTKPVTTTTTTTTKKATTVKKVKVTTEKKDGEVDNAEFGIHWYIIILIAEIILCMLIGAFLTWLYVKLTKKNKAQQQHSSLSMEDSHDEEIETALEDLQATTAQSGINEDGINGSTSLTKTANGAIVVSSHGSLQTARQPLNNNQRMTNNNKGKNDSKKVVTNTLPTTVNPDANAQPQKSKKSFLERMGNKFKRKNKESNSKKFYFQQPQISVSGFSSSTTMNLPFGESKEIIKAREKAKPLQEKQKSVKKIKAHVPFSKELGIDQQGCEPTQASREESYQAAVADLSTKKRNAQMYARLFTPEGRIRTAKELAEYDAQKAAATGSTSKKR